MTTSTTPRTVADLMTSPAVTSEATDTLQDAATRMRQSAVGSVVVVESNRPVGILTERDLLRAAAAGAEPATASVGDWMTARPDTVGPDVEVADAWRSLASHGYRHIPVVVADEAKGVVSMRDLFSVAQLRPVEGAFTDVPRGLKGVVVAETSIGDVRGLEGFYHYRQYSAVELATKRTLEDVWFLLHHGHLPDGGELSDFRAEVSQLRRLPEGVAAVLPDVARVSRRSGPLSGLRSALSLLAAEEGFEPVLDIDGPTLAGQALRVSAVVPTIVTGLYRAEQGLPAIEPRDDLSYAANYLWMMNGEEADAARVRAVEQYLMLTVDHGFNASTFTARVVASTGADIGAAVVAAIGALSGPLHGGAPSRALDTLDAIGTPDNADAWVRRAVAAGDRIMGFGHAVYRTEDPRSALLKEVARGFGGDLFDFAEQVESVVLRVLAEVKPDRVLATNVEFFAGVVMEQCGIPRPMFTPTFACSRAIGWCANIVEQAADNRIIRPSA
ncbi:MAG TPA: citrate/2-methylcitrate synthase, partial [Acidimicrobiales bacterium]|nr:citrate/2-methylcitrate synthase [Acidimicrobiales bacterium]